MGRWVPGIQEGPCFMILKRQRDPQWGHFQKHQHKLELSIKLLLTTHQQQIASAHVRPRDKVKMWIPRRPRVPIYRMHLFSIVKVNLGQGFPFLNSNLNNASLSMDQRVAAPAREPSTDFLCAQWAAGRCEHMPLPFLSLLPACQLQRNTRSANTRSSELTSPERKWGQS